MNDESTISPAGAPEDLSDPDAVAAALRKRRSSHHHHRHDARKSKWSNEERTKKMLHIKAITLIVPSIVVLVGGILWAISHYNPEESMRPQGLVKLSNGMLIAGGTCFTLALLIDWVRRLAKFMHDKKEMSSINQLRGKKRSTHHRHRRRHEQTL